MATYYAWSGASGSANGTSWANAYTTLTAAFSGKSAGDVFFVASDHAESTSGAVTLTSAGTATSPCFVYSVNRAGSVPPVSADLLRGASVTCTGNNAMGISAQYCHFWGVDFIHSPGANAQPFNIATVGSNCYELLFTNCSLQQLSTNSGYIFFGLSSANRGGRTVLENTTFKFGATNCYITNRTSKFVWRNTASAIQGSTFPATLFNSNPAVCSFSEIYIQGVDLSAITGTIFGTSLAQSEYTLVDCKIGSGATVCAAATITAGFQQAANVDLIRCDNGATNYRTERYSYQGTQTVETTIVRTGGATDGTTTISWKLVTTANSRWVSPFNSMPIAIWNDTAGSPVTVTLYGVWGGGSVPNNDDIWIEAEYLGASGNPQGSFISASKADNLATGSALSSDGSTWGGSTTAFAMSVTFTPQMKGPINIVVKAAKASTTFYVDPLVEVT